jgi:hypothetical protein
VHEVTAFPQELLHFLGGNDRVRTIRQGPVCLYRRDSLLIMVAGDPQGRRQIRAEVLGRQWAHRSQIPVPKIMAANVDDGWAVGEWVPVVPPSGSDYVYSAMAVADRIAKAPLETRPDAATWKGRRADIVARAVRMAGAGVNIPAFRAYRAAAASLPRDHMAHGDFYTGNVLRLDGAVTVIDWEFLGPAPRFTDHLRLWSTLRSAQDREYALAQIRAQSRGYEQQVNTLGMWLSYRLLAQVVSAPRRDRRHDDLRFARRLVREARAHFGG